MSALFNIAGGVRYHLRARRHKDTLWLPFREALGGWLARWQPGGAELVIIGSSAGYCLPTPWLGSFKKIACLDPDPLARWLFARRLRAAAPATALEWCTEDFLAQRTAQLQMQRLKAFLGQRPGAPVLFSNFLGQLSLLQHEHRLNVPQAMSLWKGGLVRNVLGNRAWASFHDRLSGRLPASFEQPFVAPARLSDDEIIEKLYPAPEGTVELGDHDTAGLFPAEREHVYFHWELTPRWVHLIEATRSY